MNSMEASELLRTRRSLTGSTFNEETITAWQQAFAGQDYQQCHAALISAARDEKRVTVAHIWERLPLPQREAVADTPPDLCIRCGTEPAEHLRIRCGYCQTIVDEQAATGYTDSIGMTSAMAAAKRRTIDAMTVSARPTRHWSKLPPIRGFTRVPDDALGRRMARCDSCGTVVTTLGVGYHVQSKSHIERRRPS